MNPLKWSRYQRFALGLAIILGGAAGVVVGYIVFATGTGADGAARFEFWASTIWLDGYDNMHPVYSALSGVLFAVGCMYLHRLTRD